MDQLTMLQMHVLAESVREGFQPTGGGGFSYAPNVPIPSDRYPSFIPSKEEAIGTASNIYQGIKNQFGTPEYQLSSPGYSQSQQTQQPEPEAETPFLQYLQENTEQSQGGGANEMEQGEANEYGKSPQRNYYDFVQGGGQMNNEQLRQANEMARSMGTTFDPETGYSRQPYLDYQEQGPQVQAPMSISDTRGMLQERFGSPTVYDQPDRSFYDDQSILRDQRQAARPDFGKSYKSIEDDRITRDIDKYDNRRTFAEARRLVPTERDKYGKITNREQQRAAMTLTEREVQDKKRDEYNEEYRAKNLEILQQRIDNGNKPGASKLEKKKAEVAEEILLVQEKYANYQPWMGQAIEADRMNIIPAPSGFESHLDFAAYQKNFNLDELYETMNQENNGEGGTAPVQQRSPSPGGQVRIPQGAIDSLLSNPSKELIGFFDLKYGAGSANKILNK